jgi:hypothetical protein
LDAINNFSEDRFKFWFTREIKGKFSSSLITHPNVNTSTAWKYIHKIVQIIVFL